MRSLHRATDTFRELAAIYAAVILLGAAIFAYAEGKPFDDAIWWPSSPP